MRNSIQSEQLPNEEKMNKETDPFGALEEKIDQLVAAYDLLKKEKLSLEEELAQKEPALKALEQKVVQMNQERETAREKIERLLGRIDHLILSNR
jgi:chromosome segregation ATPase